MGTSKYRMHLALRWCFTMVRRVSGYGRSSSLAIPGTLPIPTCAGPWGQGTVWGRGTGHTRVLSSSSIRPMGTLSFFNLFFFLLQGAME